MFSRIIKLAAAAAIVAGTAITATAFTATPANATGINARVVIDGASFYYGDRRHYGDRDYGKPRRHYRHGPRKYRRPHYGRNYCHPRKAVRKAGNLGLRHAHVRRITDRRIVVTGRKYGHRARLVFARYSPYCALIASRGF